MPAQKQDTIVQPMQLATMNRNIKPAGIELAFPILLPVGSAAARLKYPHASDISTPMTRVPSGMTGHSAYRVDLDLGGA